MASPFSLHRLPDWLLLRLWARFSGNTAGIEYWKRRVSFFGQRAAVNLSHGLSDLTALTEMQVREVFPHLVRQLRGDERVVLDFGCGPGRFIAALSSQTGAAVIGADPMPSLLTLAPKGHRVSYVQIGEGDLPFANGSIDVIWVCLTLGAIEDCRLGHTAQELLRALRDGGLLIMTENTAAELESPRHWRFRRVADYQRLFAAAELKCVNEYVDAGERISVLIGKKVDGREQAQPA